VFIPLFQWYTQIRFLTIAKNIIHQIQNYVESGFEVKGIIGIDGSPSCGVMKNLHLRKSFDYLANLHPENYDRDMINQEMYAKCLLEGPGFFINTLQSQLKKKKLTIPFYAHNLQKELSGNLTSSIIPK
jgi:predicted secreted protein